MELDIRRYFQFSSDPRKPVDNFTRLAIQSCLASFKWYLARQLAVGILGR